MIKPKGRRGMFDRFSTRRHDGCPNANLMGAFRKLTIFYYENTNVPADYINGGLLALMRGII